MSVDIRKPMINAQTDAGQLVQIKSYLYQLSEQLQWAFETLNTPSGNSAMTVIQGVAGQGENEKGAQDTFNDIKALIIKSADIVNAYSEEIEKKLVGVYVAESDFGLYKEETANSISVNSKGIENIYTKIEEIRDSSIGSSAHIRSGWLYDDEDGTPVYGVEVGQKNVVDGVEVFNKYARFTSGRLSFYDKNDTEVAYISDYKLYITNAEITGTLTIGRFVLDTSDGIAFNWI